MSGSSRPLCRYSRSNRPFIFARTFSRSPRRSSAYSRAALTSPTRPNWRTATCAGASACGPKGRFIADVAGLDRRPDALADDLSGNGAEGRRRSAHPQWTSQRRRTRKDQGNARGVAAYRHGDTAQFARRQRTGRLPDGSAVAGAWVAYGGIRLLLFVLFTDVPGRQQSLFHG